jgi:DNA-directed RNA polymerase subunit RPC12/RpoP
MTPEAKLWLDAAMILGRDPSAKVRCPVCAAADLIVRDVYPSLDADVFERYLECPSCKSRNIMRMKAPRKPAPSTPPGTAT